MRGGRVVVEALAHAGHAPGRRRRERRYRLEQGREEEEQAFAEEFPFRVPQRRRPSRPEEAAHMRIVHNGRVQLARGEPALAEVRHLGPDQRRRDVRHGPGPLLAYGRAVMRLGRVDGDDLARAGLHCAPPAPGALGAAPQEPYPELLVAMVGEGASGARVHGGDGAAAQRVDLEGVGHASAVSHSSRAPAIRSRLGSVRPLGPPTTSDIRAAKVAFLE